MKYIIKSTIINSVSIYGLGLIFPGIKYQNLKTLVLASALYCLLTIFVKPLLKILTFPINLITFGFFSSLINVFLIYLVTRFVPGFSVVPFTIGGPKFFIGSFPEIHLSLFWAYFTVSTALGFATSLVWWLVG